MNDSPGDPMKKESELYHFLTQETRYLILQYIIAHPENLPSLTELNHAIPKGKSTIHEHLERLQDRGIIEAYELKPEERSRDLPSTFYGLTEYGIKVANEFDLLAAKELLQTIYMNMDKPDQIHRYEEAPRPERKTKSEIQEELEELLENDGENRGSARARKIAANANLLHLNKISDNADSSPDIRFELGSGILKLLKSDSEENRGAAVSALSGIADVNAEVVAPVLPELLDITDDLDLESQLDISKILLFVSDFNPDLIPNGDNEDIIQIYDKRVDDWATDLGLAEEILKNGISIGGNIEHNGLVSVCKKRLGDIEKRRGNLDLASQYYNECISIRRESGDRLEEAKILSRLGNISKIKGNIDKAEKHHEDSLTISREINNKKQEAISLNNLGIAARRRGDLDKAEEYYQKSLDIKQEINDRDGEARTLGNLGLLAKTRGDFEKAENYHKKSLNISRETDSDYGVAASLDNLGLVYQRKGNLNKAKKKHNESLEIRQQIEDRRGVAKSLNNLGRIARSRGNLEEAKEYCQESLSIQREIGDKVDIAAILNELGLIAEQQDDLESAKEYYRESEEINKEIEGESNRSAILTNLGVITQKQGNLEEAEDYYRESLDLARGLDNQLKEATNLDQLSSISIEKGEYSTARDMLTDAFELYTDIGVIGGAVHSASKLAWLSSEQGNDEKAAEWCERGLELTEESSRDLSAVADHLRLRRQEILNPSDPPIEPVYRTALKATANGEDERAIRFFREAWDRRESVELSSEKYQLALSAGVGLLAEIMLLDLQETTDAEENITEEIRPESDKLTEPATMLFNVVSSDSIEFSNWMPDVISDDVLDDYDEELIDLEISAYSELIDRLQESTEPLSRKPDFEPNIDGMARSGSQLSSD